MASFEPVGSATGRGTHAARPRPTYLLASVPRLAGFSLITLITYPLSTPLHFLGKTKVCPAARNARPIPAAR